MKLPSWINLRKRPAPEIDAARADREPVNSGVQQSGQNQTGRSLRDRLSGVLESVRSRRQRQPVSGETVAVSENAIRIGGTIVAVGLRWEPSSDSLTRQEQAQNAQVKSGEEIDLYGYYDDEAAIVGFGSSRLDLKPGAIVGISMFPRMAGSWLGAFMVGERSCWLVAFSDGGVSEDALFLDVFQARNEFNTMYSGAEWSRVFAPPDWFIPDAEVLELSSVATQAPRRLRPLYPMRAYRPQIVGATAAVFGAVALMYGWDWYAARQVRLEQERLAVIRAEQALADLRFPWEEAPTPARTVAECLDGMERSFFSVAGWRAEPMVCKLDRDRLNFALEWDLQPQGRFYWLEAAKPSSIGGDLELIKAGTAARLGFTTQVQPEPFRENEKPWTSNEIETRVRERFNAFGIEISMSPKIRNLSPSERAQLVRPVFNYFSLRIVGSSDPKTAIALVSGIPGVVVESLVFDATKGEWEVRARIYLPPILPPPPEHRDQGFGWFGLL